MANKPKKPPADQANKAGHGGNVPPVETRWKPGQTGNPNGRPSAGASIREHLNMMADKGLCEAKLRAIAKDIKAPWPKRAAANRILRTLESGDLADFDGVLNGERSLVDLRSSGINTEVVKKIKQKTRKVSIGNGQFEDVVERELELHDRAGDDFDRVCDRTVGKPNQAVDVTSGGNEIRVKVLSGVSMEEL